MSTAVCCSCLHHISLLRQVMATQVRFVLSVCGIVVCVVVDGLHEW